MSMEKAKHYLIALLSEVLVAATVLSGCGQSQKAVSKFDLWRNRRRRTDSISGSWY